MLGRIAERAAPEQGRSKQQRSGLRLQPVRAPESFDRGQQLGRRLRGTEIWGVEKRGKQQRRGTRVRRSHAHANSSAPEWELRARKVSGAGKELTSPPAGDRPPPEWRPPEPRGRRRRGPTHRFSSLFVRKKRFTPPSRFPGGLAGKGPSLQPLRLHARVPAHEATTTLGQPLNFPAATRLRFPRDLPGIRSPQTPCAPARAKALGGGFIARGGRQRHICIQGGVWTEPKPAGWGRAERLFDLTVRVRSRPS